MSKLSRTGQEYLETDSSGSGYQILSHDGTPEVDTVIQAQLETAEKDNQDQLDRVRRHVTKTMTTKAN